MKKIILAGFAFMVLAACDVDKIKPSGNLASEERTVDGYWSALTVRDGVRVETVLGNKTSLSVTADDNLLPYVETSVESGTLVIGVRDNVSFRGRPTIRVKVSVNVDKSADESEIATIMCTDGSQLTVGYRIPYLLSVALSDGSRCSADANSCGLEINLSDGSRFGGDIKPMVNPNCYMKVGLSDGSRADLTGYVPDLEVRCSDGSRFGGYGFAADEVDAVLSDGSVVEMNVNNGINIKASDGSRFSYKGNGEVWNKELSDGSKVVKE